MKIIPIKIPNKLASRPCFVDDQDYELVKSFHWMASSGSKRDKNFLYACTSGGGRNKKTSVKMHRLIMSVPHGMVVDHIDGDGLNNRRSNLRVCTRSENSRNQRKSSNNTTGFKGVYWLPRDNRFLAKLFVNGKSKQVGSFMTAIEAAKAYNEAAKKYYGEFANLNEV